MVAIHEIAAKLGLVPNDLELYGSEIAKVKPAARERLDKPQAARLVLVSAITPTPAGEGKTTTSIGLAQGLAQLGESVCVALREPSLGPCFGKKGGGTGGGKCQVLPSDRINLHFTGDFHAVTSAHNLLAAILDNHVYFDNPLRIDPRRVAWRRVLDVNDRALRDVIIGLGGRREGVPRETGFDITAASEVMAMHLADWTITEAGFGFDLGAEKFFDIKCRSAGIDTAAVVLVATIRALKLHGGKKLRALNDPDPSAVERGLSNLDKHVENIGYFCATPIVALNRFAGDTDQEITIVRRHCAELGVAFSETDHYIRGGEGATALAKIVIDNAKIPSGKFRALYELTDSVPDKIRTVATKMYGAKDIYFTKAAARDLKAIDRLGYSDLPVCIAKTHSSLSDDPTLRGRPKDFEITVEGICINSGAGFLVVLTGDIIRMPGLSRQPLTESIDLFDDRIIGLQ